MLEELRGHVFVATVLPHCQLQGDGKHHGAIERHPGSAVGLKAVLHYAIFRVATAKSALLQLHEQIVLHPAMFLATCLATCPSGDEVKVEAYFYWLIAQNIARQVARGVLHCAMLQKSVAALPQSLRKVELDSTSCNSCCNKNVARLDDCGVCYTMKFLVQLCVATKLRDKLHEKLHSVTPP